MYILFEVEGEVEVEDEVEDEYLCLAIAIL